MNKTKLERIELRIEPSLKLKWKALADEKNLTMTDFIKSTIERNYRFYSFSSIEKKLDNMFSERLKQGRNINQMTRSLNQGGLSDQEMRDFKAYLMEFNRYYHSELKALNHFFEEIYRRVSK